jgi:2-methylaconitate cis-trans-isomerase PrpF
VTEKTIVAHVTIDESGFFVPDGNQEIAGVPGTGSPILMYYRMVQALALLELYFY